MRSINRLPVKLRPDLFPFSSSIENIIFDFGGVICDLNPEITEKKCLELGFRVGDPTARGESQKLVEDLERGSITDSAFRKSMRKLFDQPVTDQQIDDAWNALLVDIPESRIQCLEQVKKHYRLFLLSNTNEIHYRYYLQMFREKTGYHDFSPIFEKTYFSCRLKMIKPDPGIFRFVINDSKLDPAKTLFIDDTLKHVEGSRVAGLHGYRLRIDQGEQIMDLFGG
ncbi:MAG: HAD family phosphatase [Bacteroidales bacterium]|nr:HAD family phosphatase [Bacteroidales bacterium]